MFRTVFIIACVELQYTCLVFVVVKIPYYYKFKTEQGFKHCILHSNICSKQIGFL